MRWQLVIAVGILLQRAQHGEHQPIVMPQEIPVAVLFILIGQRIAEHGEPLLVAALDVVDKAVLEAQTHAPVHSDQHQHAGGKNR